MVGARTGAVWATVGAVSMGPAVLARLRLARALLVGCARAALLVLVVVIVVASVARSVN